jgi:hypothetical protein
MWCVDSNFNSLVVVVVVVLTHASLDFIPQVAIKHIKRKFKTWKACIDLREVQSLRMTRHPNIVRMMEVIRERDESLYFVFEVRI